MNKKSRGIDILRELSRRDILKGGAAASIGMASGAFGVPKESTRDFIREENSKKGTRDWRLSNTKTIPGKINKIL
ncbi:MAG: twin-arginine translocation signal domain-containing protein, partial [Opitutae bacterium]|nr:twin-arginine translocation signal domain-containing protein [Opitutae bacterium]